MFIFLVFKLKIKNEMRVSKFWFSLLAEIKKIVLETLLSKS